MSRLTVYGSGLPAGGSAGQLLATNGAGAAYWTPNPSVGAALGWQIGDTISTLGRGLGRPSGTTTTAYSANQLVFSPFYCPLQATVSELGINCTAVGGNGRLGIYAADFTAMTATLVADAGAVSCATTGFKNLTGLAVALTPGWYAAAVIFDATTTIISGNPVFSFGDTTAFAAWTALSATQTYGALPASVSGITNGNFPVPFLLLKRGS